MKKHVLLRLGRYLWRYKWLVILAAALSVASNLFNLVGPMLSGYAIDAIKPGQGAVNFQEVFFYLGWMAAFYAGASLLAYLLTAVMLHITRKVVYSMRKDVFAHLMELPVSYFDTRQVGDILSRISYDIDTVNTSLSSDLITLLSSAITVAGSFLMMLAISPTLVLIFVVTVPASMLLTKKLTGITRPLFRARSRKLGELNGFIEERMTGQKPLKAYGQEENMIEKFRKQNQEAVDAYYSADYMGSMVGPSVNLINNVSLTLVTVFGSLQYLWGMISLGNISSFVLYSRKFSGPINEAANIISEFQSAFAAAERIFRLLDEPAEEKDAPGALPLKEVRGEVEWKNVSFGYTAEKEILHHVSFAAPRGKLVAVVGPTGAGKTTIINLLMRFYDVNAGEIRVDGKEIRGLARDSLRRAYAMVLQDTWLFYGTIAENIAYGRETASREEIENAAKAAGIHDYITGLPEGYDTILSDDGANISKGQKQMLTIARAMLLNAHMLILDEATSNVDTRTEQQIQEAMRKLMKEKTCFVIAHRLSTIRNADLILVVRDGDIAEKGTHDSLMAAGGFYSRLYRAQFE